MHSTLSDDYTPTYPYAQVAAALSRMKRHGDIKGWEENDGEWIVALHTKTRSFSREGIERFLELRGDPDIPEISRKEVSEKYPRIIEHLQASYILAESEATSALRDYIRGIGYGCEAVMHAGGPEKVLCHVATDHTRHHNRKTWLSQ